MALVKEHLEQTKTWKKEFGEKTLVLTQVGSFFESYGLKSDDGVIHGSNIVEFAALNDMVVANKNCNVGDHMVVMAGVGVPYIEPYLKKMQEHDYTIVLYRQDSACKGTGRSLAEIISPGTFFATDSSALSNSILCVWLHKTPASAYSLTSYVMLTVGVANIDVFTGNTSLAQFQVPYSHDVSTYDQLERYILQYQPSECILISNLANESLLQDIVQFVGLSETKVHLVTPATHTTKMAHQAYQATKQLYQDEVLRKFYPKVALFQADGESSLATQAFCFLLDFVHQHNPNLVNTVLPPRTERNTDKLLLANHSLAQLNITDDTRHQGKHRSVCALLNHCLTAMGQRQFLYHLQNPVTSTKELEEAYDLTEYMLQPDTVALWQTWRDLLRPIQDMEKFQRKVFLQKVTPRDLAMVFTDLQTTLHLYESVHEHSTLLQYAVAHCKDEDLPTHCHSILMTLDRVFSIEVMKQVKDINSDTVCFFQKGFNADLDKVLQDSLDGNDQLEAIRVYLSTLCADVTPKTKDTSGGTAIKIHTTAKSPALLLGTSRRVLMVKAQLESRHKKGQQQVSLNYFSHYTQQQETLSLDTSILVYTDHGSAKKEMEISSSQLSGICKSNQYARDTLVTLMQTLFHAFVQSYLTPLVDRLAAISGFITALDRLQCKAYIARKYNLCKPVVMNSFNGHEDGRLTFTELRHPLIEQLQLKELYVTNDLDLTNGLLLYGTNAVGKTSFIKAVGIAVVMAQAGLYVPCSTFRFRPFTALFTRILGNDNLFKGQSTFAVEMSELRTILNLADGNSLVLGDELCSGTESNSALSIFMTGLEELHKRNSVFLFATHFHDIAHYDELHALTGLLLKHMAVRFDQEQQLLVYDRKLRDGPGQGMYGLEVCKALHLPAGFLDRAHELRRKYDSTRSTESALALPSNRYSKKKLKNMCELCRVKEASEIHHLQHQKDARSDNGYIGSFHKNHPANLVGICEACHLKTHQSTRQHKLSRAVDSGEVVLCAL